jgi:hypothetical protein
MISKLSSVSLGPLILVSVSSSIDQFHAVFLFSRTYSDTAMPGETENLKYCTDPQSAISASRD